MDEDNKEELLRMLEAHGQQFWGSINASVVPGKRKSPMPQTKEKHKRQRVAESGDSLSEDEGTEDEWSGFSDNANEVEGDEVEDDELGEYCT